jgi:hypothetical protein
MLAHGGMLNDNEKEEIQEKLFVGICDLCKQPTTFRNLCIDHNHETGAYRGVICKSCNNLLGYIECNTHILDDAMNYLVSK